MEQIARDARISTLYEGTTGIQALDLLGRKVLLNTKGKCVRDFSATMLRLIKPYAVQRTPMGQMMRTLARRTAQWNVLTTLIMLRASKDRELLASGKGKGKESNDACQEIVQVKYAAIPRPYCMSCY